MSLSQFLSIFRARWVLIIAILLAVLSLALVVSFILPSKYTASSQIVVGSKSPDPINGAMMQNGMLPNHLATQIDILKSDRVIQKVIRKLQLSENEELQKSWQSSTSGQGVFEAWLADLLLNNLEVLPSKESSVIEIQYTAVEPRFASVMANGFVQAYIETTLELRVDPARRYSSLFDEQIKQSREKLENAQNTLSEYQKAKGIVATDERLDVENARLAELSSQLVAIQAVAVESKSRRDNVGSNSAEVLNNAVVSALKADLSRQEARLKELSSSFGPAHPQVTELQANIGELRSRLDAEIQRVSRSVGINDTVNQTRESQIRAALNAQREKLLRMKAQRDEVTMLLRDVDNAQRTYDSLQARYALSNLESQSSQTDVSVLKEATPPGEASSPRIVLNAIIGVVLGLFLGFNAAIVKEMMDRRLRSEEDIKNLIGTTLVGVMPEALEMKKASKIPFMGSGTQRLTRRRSIPELSAPN